MRQASVWRPKNPFTANAWLALVVTALSGVIHNSCRHTVCVIINQQFTMWRGGFVLRPVEMT